MMRVQGEFVIGMAQLMMDKGFQFDGAFLYNDMGYRNASLFSPRLYRETHFETDRMVCEFFHRHNMPVLLHSCGRVSGLIPQLIEAGFDCLQPLEVKANMDVVELKKQYGDRLAFMGGIDARAMAHPDPAVIEREIRSKIPVAKRGGGYIFHSDHSVPDNVTFRRYQRVMELVARYGAF
jgi:uroporphyrinogen decarboxylase